MTENFRRKMMTLAGFGVLAVAALAGFQEYGKAATQTVPLDECGFCSPYQKLVRYVDRVGNWRYQWITCYKAVGGSGVCPPCDEVGGDDGGIIVGPAR